MNDPKFLAILADKNISSTCNDIKKKKKKHLFLFPHSQANTETRAFSYNEEVFTFMFTINNICMYYMHI